MIMQTAFFAPLDAITESEVSDLAVDKTSALTARIAVPCGFRDRHESPCKRLGTWPVMSDGKQPVCRDRPTVHCDPACLRAEATQFATTQYDIVE